ncbi:hypothetical protein BJV78DRAFT_1286041 [Lactifluus subvellereus]|nr:hypothetical protein BJV78DRAFT_1286041 [Lactifluus subvellereus]
MKWHRKASYLEGRPPSTSTQKFMDALVEPLSDRPPDHLSNVVSPSDVSVYNLNAEKMKAEAPTPRQTLVHELVAEFGTPLRSLDFNDRRDAAFRWVAQSLQTILDPRPLIKRMTTTTSQQTTWLKDTAPLDPAWKEPYPDCLKVTRGPATIAPIDLVMMVLLVFEFQDKLSASRVADALRALRISARKESKDLMWKSEHIGHDVVFLDHLERLGEAVPGSSSAQDAHVPMDVDPPAKRQRTGAQSQPPPPPPPARTTSASQRTPTSYNSQSQPQPQLHPSQPTTPPPMVIVPPSPSSAFITAPTPPTARMSTTSQSGVAHSSASTSHPSTRLSALDSKFSAQGGHTGRTTAEAAAVTWVTWAASPTGASAAAPPDGEYERQLASDAYEQQCWWQF